MGHPNELDEDTVSEQTDSPLHVGDRPRYGRGRYQAIVDVLHEVRSRHGGRLPDGYLEFWAAAVGKDPQTLRRWMRAGVPRYQRQRFALDEVALTYLTAFKGNASAAWQAMVDDGVATAGCKKTFQNAVARRVDDRDPTDSAIAHARAGAKGALSRVIYSRREETEPNVCWQIDAMHSPVPTPDGPLVAILVQDTYTRVIAGMAYGASECREVLQLALWRAMREHDDLSPLYGVPKLVQYDNTLAAMCEGIDEIVIAFGMTPDPIALASPWLNGKIERAIETIKAKAFAWHPHAISGPVDRFGRLYLPAAPLRYPTRDEQGRHLAGVIRRLNYETDHSALSHTPAEHFALSGYVPEPVPDERLRLLLNGPMRPARVSPKKGIAFANDHFVGALSGAIGRTVYVRRVEGTDDLIEVYDQHHRLLGVAQSGATDPHLQQEMLDERRAMGAANHRVRKRARELQARRAAAILTDGDQTHAEDPPPVGQDTGDLLEALRRAERETLRWR